MSAARPIDHGDAVERYRFFVRDGSTTHEFVRDVPASVLLNMHLHPIDQMEFLRGALADTRFAGQMMVMEPV